MLGFFSFPFWFSVRLDSGEAVDRVDELLLIMHTAFRIDMPDVRPNGKNRCG